MARILVIDDSWTYRDAVSRGLEARGHAVTQAKDGFDGIRLLESRVFDLVVTDILMPRQDGIEVILAANKLRPRPGILAVSGAGALARPDYLRMAVELGADWALDKTSSLAEMADTVETLLSKEPARLAG